MRTSQHVGHMDAKLLIVDPQNDFCDLPGAALPVRGAHADMHRLAGFMAALRPRFVDLIVTLDSHASFGIERTTFWMTGDGEPVTPFTVITEQDVRAGRFRPRAAHVAGQVLEYLQALERGGRYQLMVWPVHCVVGTWGHNIHTAVAEQIALWEAEALRPALRVLKGQNPMTEQYSAVQAEVPLRDDPSTGPNELLIERARPRDATLFVAGEAASHCVAATMEHLFERMSAAERAKVVILRDCMSPVSGFEAQAEAFFERAQQRGACVLSSEQALARFE
jgi:nicotinamidase/pyrazinamidase